MGQLREKVRDRKVLDLIRRYLEAGVVLPDGTLEATPQGVPQGGPLSPLLANIDSVSSSGDLALRAACGSPCPRPPRAPIALDPLDKELEARGHRFARYADELPRGWRSAGVRC